MSTFEVNAVRIDRVSNHPNADRLSLVTIGGYNAITGKDEQGQHRFSEGELVVYVPEGAVVPERLLKQFGYWNFDKNIGMLAGSKGNRVKAIRLRDVLSQGLVWKLENDNCLNTGDDRIAVLEGDNLADLLGVVKYEEPIPASMSGRVGSIPEAIFHFDIENMQKFPNLFSEKDIVVATEKLHGTCFRVTYIPGLNNPKLFGGNVAVCSKGLGSKGLVFEDNEENRNSNLYVTTALEYNLIEMIRKVGDEFFPGQKVSVLGEIFGKGVQDLTYGFERKTYRVFDIHTSEFGYLTEFNKQDVIEALGLERVPVLYMGPFDIEFLTRLRDGKSTFNAGFNIREGIVVTAFGDQTPRKVGNYNLRPCLKMVSPNYLLRKGGTELQ